MIDKLSNWIINSIQIIKDICKQNSTEIWPRDVMDEIIASIEISKEGEVTHVSKLIDQIFEIDLNLVRTNLLPSLLSGKEQIERDNEKKAKYDLVIFYVELSLLIPTMELFKKEKLALEKIQEHLRTQNIDYFKTENKANKEAISYQLWKFYRVFQFKEFLINNHERIASEVHLISTQTNKLIEMIDKAFLWNIANESDDNKHKYVQKFYTEAVLDKEVRGAFFKKELNLEAQNSIKNSLSLKYKKLDLPNKSDFLEDWHKLKFIEKTDEDVYYKSFDAIDLKFEIDTNEFKSIVEKLIQNVKDEGVQLTNLDFKIIELFVLQNDKKFKEVLSLKKSKEFTADEIRNFFREWIEKEESVIEVKIEITKGMLYISKDPNLQTYKLTKHLLCSHFYEDRFKCHLHSIWDDNYYPNMQLLIDKSKIKIRDILRYSNTLQEGKKTISYLAHSTGFGIHMDHTVERDVLKRYFEGVCFKISELQKEQDKILMINENVDPILPYMFGCLTLDEQNKGKSSIDSISSKINKANDEINKYHNNCSSLFKKYFDKKIKIYEIPNYGKWSEKHNDFIEWINSREIKSNITDDRVKELLTDYDIENIQFDDNNP